MALHATYGMRQALSTLYVVEAASEKFGLLTGNMKFNTQNEE
jgi:hypothetical protein